MHNSVSFNPSSQCSHLGIMPALSLGGIELKHKQAYVLCARKEASEQFVPLQSWDSYAAEVTGSANTRAGEQGNVSIHSLWPPTFAGWGEACGHTMSALRHRPTLAHQCQAAILDLHLHLRNFSFYLSESILYPLACSSSSVMSCV